jgi:predicted dehydrogenase
LCSNSVLILRNRLPVEHSSRYANQLDHFIAVIHGEVAPVVTGRDAMMTVAATLAVDRAAAEGRLVRAAEMLT